MQVGWLSPSSMWLARGDDLGSVQYRWVVAIEWCPVQAPGVPLSLGEPRSASGVLRPGAVNSSVDVPAQQTRERENRQVGGDLPVHAVLVEVRGFEPLTFSLRTRRATNCATPPSEGKR